MKKINRKELEEKLIQLELKIKNLVREKDLKEFQLIKILNDYHDLREHLGLETNAIVYYKIFKEDIGRSQYYYLNLFRLFKCRTKESDELVEEYLLERKLVLTMSKMISIAVSIFKYDTNKDKEKAQKEFIEILKKAYKEGWSTFRCNINSDNGLLKIHKYTSKLYTSLDRFNFLVDSIRPSILTKEMKSNIIGKLNRITKVNQKKVEELKEMMFTPVTKAEKEELESFEEKIKESIIKN